MLRYGLFFCFGEVIYNEKMNGIILLHCKSMIDLFPIMYVVILMFTWIYSFFNY